MYLRRVLLPLMIVALAVPGVMILAGSQHEDAQAQVSFDQDCLPYDPNDLRVVREGSNWTLYSGSRALAAFQNEAHANQGLRVARAHTEHCFIGRDNTRPDRQRYIFEYWQGDSGLDVTLPDDDCIAYDRADLSIRDAGAAGWNVISGSSSLLLLDTREDAAHAQELLGLYDNICYIGRDLPRDIRADYLMTYLTSDLVLVPGLTPGLGPGEMTLVPGLPGGDDGDGSDGPLVPLDPIVTIDPGMLTLVPPLPGDGSGTSPAPEDCISYDPGSVVLRNTADGWVVSDGTSNLLLFASQPDAQLGAQVALAHTELCFIGRGNTRPTPYRYIFEYWKGDSGLGAPLPEDTCTAYDPDALMLASTAAGTWHVFSDRTMLGAFDTEADALRARDVLATQNHLCLIGTDNTRPERYRYIHSYLLDAAPGSGTGTGPVATAPPAATPTPGPGTGSVPACPGAPAPRMVAGQQGRVTFTTGTPVRVRSGPGLGFAEQAQLPEGATFHVTGGPECSEGYYWWSIRTDTGLTGWMAEGRTGNYFIEPLPTP